MIMMGKSWLTLQILISILVGWAVSAIMTNYGAITDDKKSLQYKARTDAREDIIEKSDWFYVPYPGKTS